MNSNSFEERVGQISTATGITLKRKCRRFDEIFITGCTESCQNDNFQCSQWWKFHQNDNISVSVYICNMYTMYHAATQHYEPLLVDKKYHITSVFISITENISVHNQHYSDVIMSAMASQNIGVPIVFSTVCLGADHRKRQSSASLAFVREIHRWPVNSPHEGPVTRKMFPFDDVIMDTKHLKHKMRMSTTRLIWSGFRATASVTNSCLSFTYTYQLISP